MKSAYEIAMEKMNKESGAPRSLSDSEKKAIAEIDEKFDAQIAQLRLEHDSKIAVAQGPEREQLEQELAGEVQKIEERREFDKDKIWKSGD